MSVRTRDKFFCSSQEINERTCDTLLRPHNHSVERSDQCPKAGARAYNRIPSLPPRRLSDISARDHYLTRANNLLGLILASKGFETLGAITATVRK
jgi:hypothetical protein